MTQDTPLLTYFSVFWVAGLELNPHTKLQVCSFTEIGPIDGFQNYKSRSRDAGHAHFDLLLHFWFVGLTVNAHTEFEGFKFAGSRDTKGSQNYKSRSRDVDHAPFDLLLHFFGL